MRAWGTQEGPTFPGSPKPARSVGSFTVPPYAGSRTVWYRVTLDDGSPGFFYPTSQIVAARYAYAMASVTEPLHLYGQISVVTPEGRSRPSTLSVALAKTEEPFGYLVHAHKKFRLEGFASGVMVCSRKPPSGADVSAEPYLALKMMDLTVHHYPGRMTLIADGQLPEALHSLLTCI